MEKIKPFYLSIIITVLMFCCTDLFAFSTTLYNKAKMYYISSNQADPQDTSSSSNNASETEEEKPSTESTENSNDNEDEDNDDDDDDDNDKPKVTNEEDDDDDDDNDESDENKPVMPFGLPSPETDKKPILPLPTQQDKVWAKVCSFYIDDNFLKDWISFNSIEKNSLLITNDKREYYLNLLINNEIVYQYFKSLSLIEDKSLIISKINEWKAKYSLSKSREEKLNRINKASLERIALYETIKDILISNIITDKTFQLPSDEQISKSYSLLPYTFLYQPRKKLSHIFLGYTANMNDFHKLNLNKLSKELLSRLKKNPELFEEFAKKYSTDNNSSIWNGDIGWFYDYEVSQIPSLGEKYKFWFSILKKGQISGLINTSIGISIIMIKDETTENKIEYKNVKEYLKTKISKDRAIKILNNNIAKYKDNLITKKEITYYFDFQFTIPKNDTPVKLRSK